MFSFHHLSESGISIKIQSDMQQKILILVSENEITNWILFLETFWEKRFEDSLNYELIF